MTEHVHYEPVPLSDLRQHLVDDHDEESLRGSLPALVGLHHNHHEADESI